jgi:hypothetical protein
MAQYRGAGLSVTPTDRGASLTCVFQRLRAEATPDGLWLLSPAAGAEEGRFQIIATRVGREAALPISRFSAGLCDWQQSPLPETGTVQAGETLVRFVREGLTEEYSVDLDGIRQDFLVPQRPDGEGRLILELAVAGSDLYCGGTFSTAGGTIPANNIAKWDGTTWTALGSGVTGTSIPAVNALAVRGGELFVGGSFYMAGDKASQYFAEAVIGGIPLPGRFDSLAYSPVTGFACRFLNASIGQAYRIQTSPRLTNGGWSDFTNFVYTGPTNLNVPLAGPSTNKFIRAITP